MQYLADTVAIIRHFAGAGRIGKAAKLILQGADHGRNTILMILRDTDIMIDLLHQYPPVSGGLYCWFHEVPARACSKAGAFKDMGKIYR